MRANSENKTRKFAFKATADHMYSKRQIPVKALEALEVLGKIVARFDQLIARHDADAAQFDAAFLLNFTTSQALEAFSKRERAFLPPVFRHLLVQVRKNWRDGGSVSVVQEFSNNARFMQMLDDAWKAEPFTASMDAPLDVKPIEEPANEINTLSGNELIRQVMRREAAAPKPEPKTVVEIEVGGQVQSVKTVPKALVISRVPTVISKGKTFAVEQIVERKGGDILVLKGGLRVPAEYFAPVVTLH